MKETNDEITNTWYT